MNRRIPETIGTKPDTFNYNGETIPYDEYLEILKKTKNNIININKDNIPREE